MTSFVAPEKLQLLKDSRYEMFETDLGYVFIKPDLAVHKETVTLGLKKILFVTDITVDGVYWPGLIAPSSVRRVGRENT